MLSLVCFTTFLALPPVAPLELHVDLTWGTLGPARGERVYAPRDRVHATVRATGLTPDKLGQVSAILTLELKRPDGTSEHLLRRETGTVNLWKQLNLSMQFTHAIGPEDPPGTYVLCVRVLDRHTGQEARHEVPFEVAAKGFALLGPVFFADPATTVAVGPHGLCGQRLFVKLGVVGFGVAGHKSKARCRAEVLDAQGQVVFQLNSPLLELPPPVLSFDADLPLIQPGSYTLRLTVQDEIAKAERSVCVPLKVSEP